MQKIKDFIKNNKGKILLVVIIVVITLFFLRQQSQLQEQQLLLNNKIIEMKTIGDDIVRSQTSYVTKKDLEKFSKDIDLDIVKKDLDDLDASIIGISRILASSAGEKKTGLISYIVYQKTDPPQPTDPIPGPDNICKDDKKSWCVSGATSGYLENAQVLSLSEKFKQSQIPIGTVTFKAWKDKPWDIDILKRDYNITSVLSTDTNGKHYLHHKFMIKSGDKEQAVNIDNAEFVETLPDSQWEWWNPKIGMGVSAGVSIPTTGLADKGVSGSFAPSIYISPFSYGKTKIKPDIIVGQVGVGFEAINKSAQFSLSPIMYNIGASTQVINNTYIGPTVSVDTNSNVMLGGTLMVTF